MDAIALDFRGVAPDRAAAGVFGCVANDEGQLRRVIGGFGDAALGELSWLDALQGLADLTGSAHAQLIGIGGAPVMPFNWVTGFPEDALADLIAIDGYSPQINSRVAASIRAAPMELVHERHYDAVTPLLASDIYRDYAHDHDIPFGCQTALQQDADGLIGLAILRSDRDGATGDVERAAFAAVAPHVRAAVRLQLALEHQGARLMAGGFEAMNAAAFLCDAAGRVVACTPMAETLLADGRLRMQQRQLTAPRRADGIALQRAIGTLLAQPPDPRPLGIRLAIAGLAGDRPLLVELSALPRRAWDLGRSPRVLLVVRGVDAAAGDRADALRALYCLSEAEADIAVRLAAGADRAAIAAARGVSVATVRSQLKSVFAKLDVTREVELVLRLSQLDHPAR